MKLKMLAAVAALALSAAGAHASTLTFETALFGPGFTGPVTENGFTYSTSAGFNFVNALGNPGQDMEGEEARGGGVLTIIKATPGQFTFDSLDYAAFDKSGLGSQILVVKGYLGGNLVETNSFTLANTNVHIPNLGNWTLETNLTPMNIDRLDITLNATINADRERLQGIDNVNLTSVGGGVPEPAAWALMLVGFGGLGAALRSRRRLAVA